MCDDETREVPDEDVEQVSGGIITGGIKAKDAQTCASGWGVCPPCPNCGSTNTHPYAGLTGLPYACGDCETAFG